MKYIPGTKIIKPHVDLVGEDGNAFMIMGRVRKALKRAGAPRSVIDEYMEKSTSGDYNNLLVTALEYIEGT